MSQVSTPPGVVAGDALALERIIHLAAFRAALRVFQRRSEKIARRWGLTPQRFLLLLAIKGAPEGTERLNLTEAATRLQLSRNSVTELCRRAEDAGLVERRRSSTDQRVVYLSLTDEGERRLRGALLEGEVAREAFATSFADLVASFAASGPDSGTRA
jgi:DNA-binding MarR family transcriptional regulator